MTEPVGDISGSLSRLQIDDTEKQHHSRSTYKPKSKSKSKFKRSTKQTVVIPCKKFSHAPVNYVLEKSPILLRDSEELYTCSYKVDKSTLWNSLSTKPALRKEICNFIAQNKWDDDISKNRFIGSNLTEGYEDYVPLPQEVLDSVDLLMQAYDKYNEGLDTMNKTTFISLRHHIIDIIMCPFQNETVSLIMTVLPDRNILISVDKSQCKPNGIHQLTDPNIRKICYTGFALENLLIDSSENENDSQEHELYYSFVRGIINDDVEIFFQAEMDSYNPLTNSYTEIKSSVNFNLNNAYHRKKLLRMWVQTNLLPRSDLLIGFRNPYSNELEQLRPYKIQDIYQKVNNRSILGRPGKFFRYNAVVARDWFHHIFSILKTNLLSLAEPDKLSSFKVQLDPNLNLSITPTTQSIKDLKIQV